jgi:hypothetical protein
MADFTTHIGSSVNSLRRNFDLCAGCDPSPAGCVKWAGYTHGEHHMRKK